MWEFLWYLLASVGAGVGTGLAGLSAATVMVPVFIVLCPSFAGESGPYQATAIALASDILGSAIASYTYARNKNIDLKRGWIMLVCILSMSAVGSYFAWLAGNVVLGGFSLFLTFFIGIRFLIKPDTSRKETAKKGGKLGWKEVLISLFFGLTIGFGTGFVGTGGGMMMLVVFTAFLRMELKSAVGTSTFIMTFTAIIASISHILIHPAIVWERWNVLLLCIVVSTLASLFSARFANRISNKTIGLCTGAILTGLGGFLLLLNYWSWLDQILDLAAIGSCLLDFVIFIIPAILILLMVRFGLKPKGYVFRKLLHLVAFSLILFMVWHAESFLAFSFTLVILSLLLSPILWALDHFAWFKTLLEQKKPKEILFSFLLLFLMAVIVFWISWQWLQAKALGAAAILMWGVGDGAGALIGIPYGKHAFPLKKIHHKSIEGTVAVFVFSLLAGLLLFSFLEMLSLQTALLVTLTALAGTAAELLSPSEWDTFSVPLVNLCFLLPVLL